MLFKVWRGDLGKDVTASKYPGEGIFAPVSGIAMPGAVEHTDSLVNKSPNERSWKLNVAYL